MTPFAATLPPLVGALTLLLLLAWLSRQVSLYVQHLFFALTRSHHAPTLAIFLLFLPGVVIHEAAHWGMARLLGLRTGKFRVWPKRQGRHIGLGSVSVESRHVVLDSLVGIAPLLVGTALVAIIGNAIFDAPQLATQLAAQLGRGDLRAAYGAFRAALDQPNGLLWAYLLFTIANAMMPSASDREPLKPVLSYTLLAAIIYILLGMPLQGAVAALTWLAPVLANLTAALLFVALLDGITLAALFVLRLALLR
jgi:hypothetical protein